MKSKFYVVWKGRKPGIYESWDECKRQIHQFPKARYKSYPNHAEALVAYNGGTKMISTFEKINLDKKNKPVNFICVDGTYSNKSGIMEYRGLSMPDSELIFHKTFTCGTNNIGEFLGIVDGLIWCKENDCTLPMYSDSITALSWIRQRKCKTGLISTPATKELEFEIKAAEYWLKNNTYTTKVLKWDTRRFKDIPADFGNKKN